MNRSRAHNVRANGVLVIILNLKLIVYIALFLFLFLQKIPGSSAGKESTCNSGDTSLIPGLGSSPRKGIGFPFQAPNMYLLHKPCGLPGWLIP